MTIPLTPDEVVARCRAKLPHGDDEWLNRMAVAVMQFETAGLVVVDATDSPPIHAGHGCTAEAIERGALKMMAGGSPGERGTVTQETSADDDVGPLSRLERKAALAGFTTPFPGFHPGPQVDGQPTWGAYLRDVPDDGYQTRTHDGDPWESVERLSQYTPASMWVLVRRTPQPDVNEAQPDDLLMEAWGVIANARGWDEDSEWRQAAIRWRDRWHEQLNAVDVLVENEEPGT